MTAASETIVSRHRSAVTRIAPDLIATATLAVETRGPGFTDITQDAARFLTDASGPILTFASRFGGVILRMLESKDH